MPAKKPTAQLKAEGTFREDRHGGGDLRIGGELDYTPDGLSPAAESLWKLLAPLLSEAGLVCEGDAPALAALCELFAQEAELREAKHNEPHVIVDNHGKASANPTHQMWLQVSKELRIARERFGLDPVARAKVAALLGERGEDGSAFDDLPDMKVVQGGG